MRCSHVAFSCDEKHTDLELVIRKDYQLFLQRVSIVFRLDAQTSATLVGLTEELTCS